MTNNRKSMFFALTAVIPALYSTSSQSTILVEDYPMASAISGVNEIDSDLAHWLSEYSNSHSVSDMTEVEIQNRLGDIDPLSLRFAKVLAEKNRIKRSGLKSSKRPKKNKVNEGSKTHGKTEKIKSVRSLKSKNEFISVAENLSMQVSSLEKDLDIYNRTHDNIHPLTAYILAETLSDRPEDSRFEEYFSTYVPRVVPNSCPQKTYVTGRLSSRGFLKNNREKVRNLLLQAKGFRSYQSRNEILRQVLAILPVKMRPHVIEELWPLVRTFSHHLRRNKWIEKLVKIDDSPKGVYGQVEFSAKKRHCNKARNQFVDLLSKSKGLVLVEARLAARKIGNCFKRRGSVRRIQVWKQMTKPLQASFGTSGWAVARIAVARYEWTLDRFDVAEKILEDVMVRTAKEKNDKFLAEATYILAQVYENKGDEDLAIDMYESYRTHFPDDPVVYKVLSTLLLAYAGKGEWLQVLSPAKQIIDSQDELDIDDREVSVLGFALFWQGRAYIELQKEEFAEAAFTRLSKEYYSTYYGAIGHYLLEQMGGVKWALKSGPSVGFMKDAWYDDFSKVDRSRLATIETLLQMGLKSSARCEISELDVGDHVQRRLVKALLLRASGKWLSSIKMYSNLPRSFRHSLPFGMEILLFPKKFEDDINSYAGKLGVDPDFVFALIRQESVFNPQARSPAGAKGLMQLMPRTASIEAKKIRSPYVTKKIRRRMISQVKKSNNLFNADTNILLGTHHLHRLLSNYQGPVFTLSAYNAGPTAASRWRGKIDSSDLLYFIEKIPYKETRGYVKLILRNYFYYSRWYGDKDKPLPHLRSVMKSTLAKVESEKHRLKNLFH